MYTPTTDVIKMAYVFHAHAVHDHRRVADGQSPHSDEYYEEEFDRWYASVNNGDDDEFHARIAQSMNYL